MSACDIGELYTLFSQGKYLIIASPLRSTPSPNLFSSSQRMHNADVNIIYLYEGKQGSLECAHFFRMIRFSVTLLSEHHWLMWVLSLGLEKK